MAVATRTLDQAVSALTDNWSACRDALGLVLALEKMGVIHIERPPPAASLIAQAKQWSRPGGIVEVSPSEMANAVRLISDLGKALEVALDTPSQITPHAARS